MNTFNDVGLPASLASSIARMSFTIPTPIQKKTIPLALEGKDILGTAQTGTGKTAAYGIPLVAKLISDSQSHALVLTPTRELAIQVMDTLKQLMGRAPLPTALLIGGDSMPKQFRQLKAHPRLIVGTPGRINDHLERKTLILSFVDFLVLDETDRMLDMGFDHQLRRIVRFLTRKRQTLMFSATLPEGILVTAKKYLSNPVRISVGSTTTPLQKIEQKHVHLGDSEKYPRLLLELEQRCGSVLVFVKTKRGAARLAKRLSGINQRADALHGNLRQNQREKVMSAFRKMQYRILVATDVASRGLDVPHISHVINYDLPQCPEDYIHRIGRTARADKEGSALSLLTAKDRKSWRDIQLLLDPSWKEPGVPAGRIHKQNHQRSSR